MLACVQRIIAFVINLSDLMGNFIFIIVTVDRWWARARDRTVGEERGGGGPAHRHELPVMRWREIVCDRSYKLDQILRSRAKMRKNTHFFPYTSGSELVRHARYALWCADGVAGRQTGRQVSARTGRR